MFGLGIPEILIILIAIGVLLFGGKKIVEVARAMGRASGEFKKGKQDIERELNSEHTSSDTATDVPSTDQKKQ